VFIVVGMYFVIDSVRKRLDTPSYIYKVLREKTCLSPMNPNSDGGRRVNLGVKVGRINVKLRTGSAESGSHGDRVGNGLLQSATGTVDIHNWCCVMLFGNS